LLRTLLRGEGIIFMAIAVALLAIAVWVFVRGIHDLVVIPHGEPFAVTIIGAVNSALFIVVVVELMRTIVARLEGGSFQLQPFLVIGINVGGAQAHEIAVRAECLVVPCRVRARCRLALGRNDHENRCRGGRSAGQRARAPSLSSDVRPVALRTRGNQILRCRISRSIAHSAIPGRVCRSRC
jgi:hypothetical protein